MVTVEIKSHLSEAGDGATTYYGGTIQVGPTMIQCAGSDRHHSNAHEEKMYEMVCEKLGIDPAIEWEDEFEVCLFVGLVEAICDYSNGHFHVKRDNEEIFIEKDGMRRVFLPVKKKAHAAAKSFHLRDKILDEVTFDDLISTMQSNEKVIDEKAATRVFDEIIRARMNDAESQFKSLKAEIVNIAKQR